MVLVVLTPVTPTEMNQRSCRRVRTKRTYKMKKVWGTDEMGRFFVTGARDAVGKPSHICCRICRKDVSVLAHGPSEVLRHYQGVKHFPHYKRLRLQSPGWRALDVDGNPLKETELERQKERILRDPLVIRDRKYLFADDLIVDDFGTPNATLPVFAKVSSLMEVLRLGGLYELVHQLWAQSSLSASCFKLYVTWSRDGVLVGTSLVQYFYVSMSFALLVLCFSQSCF